MLAALFLSLALNQVRPHTNYLLRSQEFANPAWMVSNKLDGITYCQLVYLNAGMYAASIYGDSTTMIEVSADWWPTEQPPIKVFIPTVWRRVATVFNVPYSGLTGICYSSKTGRLWGAQVEVEYPSDYIRTNYAPVTKI